jgi:hypothetical protein
MPMVSFRVTVGNTAIGFSKDAHMVSISIAHMLTMNSFIGKARLHNGTLLINVVMDTTYQ